jgi:uncharacterized repeat protein (TIGR01451 family)
LISAFAAASYYLAFPPVSKGISINVVISEFRVRGPNGGNDEFVEIYNLSSSAVNIGGWKMKGSNNSGTTSTRATVAAGVTLNPGCHFLFTNTAASGYSGAVPGNQTYTTGITDDGGIAITLPDDTIVDQVGMSAGSAFKEGTPLASLGGTSASNLNRGYERKPGGASGNGTDTDNNSTDFQLITPSDPQNLSSTCIAATTNPSGVGAASPGTVPAGGSSLLSVTVTPGTNPASTGIAVTGDLSLIGGSMAQPFFDDGTNGDIAAGDNVFSFQAAIPLVTTAGLKNLPVTITDAQARTGNTVIALTVTSSSTSPSGIGAASPPAVSVGAATLLSVAVTPGANPTSTGIVVQGDLTPIGGSATQQFFDDGTNGDATSGDNTFSFSATVAGGTTTGNKSLPITITDAQSRTGATTISLTVNPPLVAIHDIQGNGNFSPLAGQTVATSGIVTGLRTGSSGGLFIQTPDASIDADPNTSEGIFVFTGSSLPAAAVIGNLVTVTGRVQEFAPSTDPVSPTATELSNFPTVTLISSGNPLPAPTTLTPADTSPAGSLDVLERFEGMRVHVDSLTVVAPTDGFTSEQNATSTSNGIFFGVIAGVARPFREPGIERPDVPPAGSPANIPVFDANPERIRVDSDAQPGSSIIDVTAGALITNLTGPLDYGSRVYTILPDAATPPTVTGNISAIPVPLPSSGEFTVASFNMERFFDTTNDPGVDDVALTAAAFNNRLNKASLAIRNVMRMPDIIGVEEVENLGALQAIANKVNTDAVAEGGPNPLYQAFLVEGNDPGGIDSGFLVKSSRVSVIDVTQEGKTTTYINPNNGLPELLNDRPPLILRGSVTPPSGSPFALTVIVNHLRSLSGVDDPVDGNRVRTKRRAQAEFLANLIQARQAADPNEYIVSVGDYNAFQFNDGYVDGIGTIKGTPTPADQVVLASSDLVNPDLTDLVDLAPANQRYSFLFGGNAQELDHILVTANLLPRFNALNYARSNADFPEIYRTDANRPERLSDHDMPVAYFSFPSADLSINKSGVPDPVLSGAQLTYTITVANTMADPAMNLAVTDTLPAHTTFQSITAPVGWTPSTPPVGSGGTVTLNNPSLASGATAAITLVVNVECDVANGTTITNTASVTSSTFDPNPGNNSAMSTVTVSNPAPVVTPPPNLSFQCLSQVPAPNASDATVSDNCGSPSISVTDSSNGGAGSVSSPLVITRTFTAADSGGNTGSASQSITVIDNTPPVITLSGPNPMTIECHAVFTDPGATASDNCGGNLTSQITASGSVNPNQPGTYTRTYMVTDPAGNTVSATRSVVVVDTTPPSIACPANITVAGNILGSCGASVNPGQATADDACSGAVTPVGSRSDAKALNAAYPPGVTTITWTATDASGNSASCVQTITVTNANPVATITAPSAGAFFAAGAPVNFTGMFTDNPGGTHLAEWQFGSVTKPGLVNEVTGAITGSFAFATPGVYTVTLKVTDGCGGLGLANTVGSKLAIVFVFDPISGFASGGGQVDSPAGALPANPALSGKGVFAFACSYTNGALPPKGSAEFHFGSLNLQSTSFEFLVVADAKAVFRGMGKINGAGNFGFMFTVIDGQVKDAGGVDRLRIKIWDKNNNDTVVYDNQMGSPDTANPALPVSNGNVIVHK